MTRQELVDECRNTYGTTPDHPFGDELMTAVLRHADTRKWYALVMRVPWRKFGIDRDGTVDTVNLKLPIGMLGSFRTDEGVYPAYHMNKRHWVSVLLPEADDGLVRFLLRVSFEATGGERRQGTLQR